jgi:ubiquinone/menaquinone biosynthesis C-methylase UbiE
VSDRLFSLPRLAGVYDALDPDRNDLPAYAALIEELGARSVVDVGCGTGTFAVLLASRGVDVTGVDPAHASLDVAKVKPGADRVTWVHADAASLPSLTVDAVTMTGNVAQVFISDAEWEAALAAARRVLRPGGHLIFETRNPDAEAWRTWTREATYRRTTVDGIGLVERWEELTDMTASCVSFRTTFVYAKDNAVITSDSTLRFRKPHEIRESLHTVGFTEPEILEAPDRPGLELVFIAANAATR